jgi:acetyl-CoA carboxylase carboxyl transferase subunit beta
MDPLKKNKKFMTRLKSVIRTDTPVENLIRDNDVFVCPNCGRENVRGLLKDTCFVCPQCGHHYKISARARVAYTVDQDSFRELSRGISGGNPLGFPDYEEKLAHARTRTGLREAVVTGSGRIDGIKVIICIMDSRFMMASMGMAVGEKITRACEYATRKKLPLIIFCASGGARMQEGILSLLQMAKTSAAVARHGESGLLYISVMTDPTTGGVSASFASLADITVAEPGALIGFAGPRVIEQTINQELPAGFQRAEFQRDHGFVDLIVERRDMKEKLALLLRLHGKG